MATPNHYKWLEAHLSEFFAALGLPCDGLNGLIVAHGDKCYGYRDSWEQKGIPFAHGVAIYLLTYFQPYSSQVRDTKSGWVPVDAWVAEVYGQMKASLPPID
jgi:hypothetical protein